MDQTAVIVHDSKLGNQQTLQLLRDNTDQRFALSSEFSCLEENNPYAFVRPSGSHHGKSLIKWETHPDIALPAMKVLGFDTNGLGLDNLALCTIQAFVSEGILRLYGKAFGEQPGLFNEYKPLTLDMYTSIFKVGEAIIGGKKSSPSNFYNSHKLACVIGANLAVQLSYPIQKGDLAIEGVHQKVVVSGKNARDAVEEYIAGELDKAKKLLDANNVRMCNDFEANAPKYNQVGASKFLSGLVWLVNEYGKQVSNHVDGADGGGDDDGDDGKPRPAKRAKP